MKKISLAALWLAMTATINARQHRVASVMAPTILLTIGMLWAISLSWLTLLEHQALVRSGLLFTHGTADTNVPIGESIQMYNALRILGVPTAFVEVEGENHGIMDPAKRTKWINSIMAWFQKYLKNDDSWWNAIYTPKKL